jgi:adenylosuccinate synthase
MDKIMIEYADAVIGLQYGDEAKSKLAAHLSKTGKYTHTVRFSGSNNAGHTIYVNGKKYVFHSVPVGVAYGIKSIIGPGCVVNVEHFFNELRELEDAGINTGGLIYIANNAHIITDSHLSEDRSDSKIGTTKRGNGPAYRDKYAREGTRASEIKELQPYLIDIHKEFYNPDNTCRILFEGAQGFYLDIDWGDYPYVTSSHCTVGSAILNGVPPQKIRRIYGAAKIYETYVGAKEFEPKEAIFEKIRELGGEYGATTGRPRQCNWLNLDNLKKAAQFNGVTHLVVSKMDILRELGCWSLIEKNERLLFSTEHGMKSYIEQTVDPLADIEFMWSDNPHDIGERNPFKEVANA